MDDAETERARRALAESEQRYREVFDTNPAVKLIIDPEGGAILDANSAACRFYGYPRAELLALRIQDINLLPEVMVQEEMKRARSEKRLFFNFKHRTANGTVRDVEVYSGPVTFNGRRVLHSIIIDVSERRRLEEQLVRSQRMEAIGQLAGGVAHDFNNILTVILGYAAHARRHLTDDHPAAASVAEIREAAERATEITRQLLTLAKRHVPAPEYVDLNALVLRTDRMLRRLIGEDIELVTVPETGLWPAQVEPGRFQQVLVNLAVNARDAMPRGGRVTLTTNNRLVHGAEVAGLLPGKYVCLTVEDTGTGIDPEIEARIFEPFFTTREERGGSGLGLCTCQSILEQSGGVIRFDSQLGVGTRFEVFLPATDHTARSVTPSPPRVITSVQGTILVAEDEPAVRRLVIQALTHAGYHVLSAHNGDEALRVVRECEGRLDLLLTDVVMPLVGGTELALRVRRSHPALPVLFMSGYPGNFDESVLDAKGIAFLQKPFAAEELLAQVAELLTATRDERED